MSDARDAVAAFLDEYPELEGTIEELVALDDEGSWTFDDVPCDSGSFGEIVSREFVESFEDGYQLVDREAARTALRGEPLDPEDRTEGKEGTGLVARLSSSITGSDALPVTGGGRSERPGLQGRLRHTVNLQFWVPLVTTLVFLVVMRTIIFRSVFREKFVVFSGNDPYHYRHHVDQLLAASPGLLDFSGISGVLGGRSTGEPFMYVLGWWLTRLVEGTPATSGYALAWLPVIAAVVVGVSVTWMALAVTEDERIAVLSLLAFALTPAHALYSGIGFFDHHAFDYVWLVVMAATLVWLARAVERRGPTGHLRRPGTWLVTTVFGLACGAAMLTWNGAPLLLLGLVLYAVLRPASAVRTGNSPLRTNLPVVVGLGTATVMTHLLHSTAGWQEPAVVYAPALVLVGVVGVSVLSELVIRRGGEPWWVLAASAGVGLGATAGTWLLTPGIFRRFRGRFLRSLLGRDSAAETQSLFQPELALTFNPIQYFGLLLLFVLPALALVTRKCVEGHEPRWLVLTSYGWATFGLSVIQIRFTGQLSPFASVFAAVGLVWALSTVGLCRPLNCFRRRTDISLQFRAGIRNVNKAAYLSFVLMIVIAVGIVFTIGILNSVTIDDQQYESAAWISENGDAEGGFVLSHWGRNRMYNYFSWGGGDGYSFAQTDYDEFLASEDPDRWYSWLVNPENHLVKSFDSVRTTRILANRPDGEVVQPDYRFAEAKTRVDYVVFDEHRIGQEFPYEAWINAVGQFQLVYLSESDRVSVFKTVEGAMVTGQAGPGTTVEVTTDIEISGYEYTYTRQAAVDSDGEFAVRVAYPGTYTVGNRSVDVSSANVNDGESVSIVQTDG